MHDKKETQQNKLLNYLTETNKITKQVWYDTALDSRRKHEDGKLQLQIKCQCYTDAQTAQCCDDCDFGIAGQWVRTP